ncbi:MAG: hypothetical protein ABFC84_17085 [Veillonellales bacterium]
MSNDTPDKSLIQTITRMIDSFTNDSMNSETFISALSLLCLLSILNRSQPSSVQSVAPANHISLQKILGELTKSDNSGGPSPDMLMTLLPLLNSPQLKAKLNPANITAILGLVNSLGGNSSDKHDAAKQDTANEAKPESPAAAVTTSAASSSSEKNIAEPEESDKKPLGRYLNWKSNF